MKPLRKASRTTDIFISTVVLLEKEIHIRDERYTPYRTETCDISLFLFPQESSVQQVKIVQLSLLIQLSRLCHICQYGDTIWNVLAFQALKVSPN